MKNFLRFNFLLITALAVNYSSAQCVVTATSTPAVPVTVNCGEQVVLQSQGFAQGPALFADFNANSLGAGWTTTQNIMYNNPCGPSLDGTSSAWMGSTATQPRELNTVGFDLSCGAQICFDLDFADDDPCGCNDCEDPDQANEGVFFRYSIDNGATWVDIFYFQPNATGTGPYYSWANYCFTLPAAAWSANTMFQWRQDVGSTANFDHWGIDNVEIQPINCSGAYYYEWNGNLASQDTTVYPTATGDYTVMYTNGFDDTCTFVVPVTVNQFNVTASATPSTIDCGDATDLVMGLSPQPSIPGANYVKSWTPAATVATPANVFSTANPITTTTYTATITEANSGCTGSVDVVVTVNPLDPWFDYPLSSICLDEAVVNANLTGTTGGTYSSTAGLTLDPNSGAITPSTSTPGTYAITYTPNPACPYDSTLTVDIHDLPIVDAGIDQQVCAGVGVTLNGAGADTYVWDNGITDGNQFVPISTTTYTVTGTDLNGCENTDMVDVTVLPQDDPTFTYNAGLEYCFLDDNPIANILGTTGGSFSFDLISGGSVLSINPVSGDIDLLSSEVGEYLVHYNTSAAGLCPDSSSIQITIHQMPDANFNADIFTGCEPQSVNFTAVSTDPAQICTWNFGNGTSSNCGTVANGFMSGIYDISLTIESEAGCITTETYDDYIDITAMPVASFIPSPSVTNIEFTDIRFNNYSQNSDTYIWNFGDSIGVSTDESPNYLYDDVPAQYLVTLTSFSDDMLCSHSSTQVVTINDILTYYIPNSFTPNGDAFNNTFKPVFTSGYDYYDFHMYIFNRYGEVIFETYNPDFGWNGVYGGEIVPDGVYIWQIQFGEDQSDKLHEIRGHVTVVK